MDTILAYCDLNYKQKQAALKAMKIIVDTREQKNNDLLLSFSTMGIGYIEKALSFGDYSYMVVANGENGLPHDISMAKSLAIERKASLDEMSGNFTVGRERFEREMIRGVDSQLYLLIENASISDIYEHRYKSQMTEKSFMATLLTWRQRYGFQVEFVSKSLFTRHVANICYYHLKAQLCC